MVWNIFGKKKKVAEDEIDPLKDMVVSKLKVGWMLDFESETYEVRAHHKYDWGDGDLTDEWELHSGKKILFLEYDPEDGGYYTVMEKIPLGKLEGNVRSYLKQNEEAPDKIIYDGKTYYLEAEGGGHFLEHGKRPEQEFLFWDYEDEDGELIVSLEQWSDTEFEAHAGKYVKDYHFENILPR
jgi:hypothetical protein